LKNLSFTISFIFIIGLNIQLSAQTFYSYQGPGVLRENNLQINRSFCINPNQLGYATIDSLNNISGLVSKKKLTILPAAISFVTTSNSPIPSGINQGPLISNVGKQQLISLGLRVKWKNKVDINFSPEYQFAENKPFPVFPTYNRDWTSFYHFLNHIDAPEKFGEFPLKKLYAGQSYLKVK
jgi:hypothetical protein